MRTTSVKERWSTAALMMMSTSKASTTSSAERMMKFTWRCSGVSTRRKARAPAVILFTMTVGAHLLGLVAAAAGDHEAAREQLVAHVLGHQVALAGEQRLVGLHVLAAGHAAVDHHLVARVQHQQVAEHQLAGVDLPLLALPDHRGFRAA